MEEGYTGTLDEWLDSLIGATGEKGDTGATGAQGEKGDKGDKGDTGADGKSAYDLAIEKGFDGTEEEWLASLKGIAGEQGETGKSAYEWRRKTALKGI